MVERDAMVGGLVMNEDPYLPDEKCRACGKRGVAVTGDLCGLCKMRLTDDALRILALRTIVFVFASVLCVALFSWWFWGRS